MLLRINVPGAEPYLVGDEGWAYYLDEAIEKEAENVLSEANADHLEEPTEECYDALRRRVIEEASAALNDVGDTYTDPIGITWSLESEGER